MSKIDDARAAGYSEEEIQQYLAPKIQAAKDSGYSQEEINQYLGIKPIDHASANNSLAERVVKSINEPEPSALDEMTQTVKDMGTVYAPVEGALNVITGAIEGFPAYLIGGAYGLYKHYTSSPETDPKKVAEEWSRFMTYQPQTDAGKRFTTTLTYPFAKLNEAAQKAGEKVVDIGGTPTEAAITEATLQTLPFVVLGSFGKSVHGKTPTSSDIHVAADQIAHQKNPEVIVDPALVKEMSDNVQTTYEKSGIHPAEQADMALTDPTVKADLASSNFDVPKALGGTGNKTKPLPPEKPRVAPEKGTTEAAQQAVLGRINFDEAKPHPLTLEHLYAQAKDDLYPIKAVEKALTGGKPLETAESPYILSRLVRGSAGKATQFLDYGAFDFKTYKDVGPSLKQILEPHKADLDGLRAYAVAKRSQELKGRGIETGIPSEEAATVVKNGAQYEKTFMELQDYQQNLVKYMRDSGLLSEEGYSAMLEANKDYVPFYRAFAEQPARTPGKGLRVSNPIKKIKGSERQVIDPIESIIKNTYVYTALAERNAAVRALGDLVEKNPETAADIGIKVGKTAKREASAIKQTMEENGIDLPQETAAVFKPEALRPSANSVRYYKAGKPVTLDVPRELADAINATDQHGAGLLLKVLAFPAKALRAGATITPDFIMRNMFRDQVSAYAFSESGYIPVVDFMRGAMSLVKKDKAFNDWLKSGGANSALVSLDREYLQQHLVKLDKETGLSSRAWNVAKSPLEVLRITSELAENATRLGEFKRHMAKTKGEIQQAGYASREVTLDFQRIGSQTRALNMLAAFMNAGVEGLDRTIRAFKDNPMRTSAKVTAAITLPSVLLWLANNSSPERQQRYREIPHWERDLFWIVMTDEHIYRIPKPFELGIIFGSAPERMLDQFMGDDPKAMKDFMNSVGQVASVGLMPTGAVPILEQMTNHSFFTDNPLVPSRMENLLPEYQYEPYTSQVARKVGSVIGAFPSMHEKSIASPIVIDNYIRAWTGGLGTYTEQALDYGLRKAGMLPDPPMPIATLADIPFIKAFVVRYPSASAQSVADFYEEYAKRSKAYNTFQTLVKQGDIESAMKEIKIEPGAFMRLEGIHSTIGQLNKIIRMVYVNPDMTPSDKRQLIDSLYGQMITLSREGVMEMDNVDKAIE